MSLVPDFDALTAADKDSDGLARRLGEACLARQVRVTTAESCTGGGVACAITAMAGSSAYFETGYVTYSNQAKQRLLGVTDEILDAFGAVSAETVREMVVGACGDSGATLGVAVSGVAGPGGGSLEKPVGTVWFAWGNDREQCVRRVHIPGDRAQVRERSVTIALAGLVEWLTNETSDMRR